MAYQNHLQTMYSLPAPQRPVPAPYTTFGAYPPAQPQPVGGDQKPLSRSGRDSKYTYTLEVVQQPTRARMCGFGDKDRRPITPPPCIRLIVTHNTNGNEVTFQEIESSFFVLQVDLWDEYGQKEANIVRTSSTTPATSISSATTTSYPPPPERPYQLANVMNHPPQPHMMGYPGHSAAQAVYAQYPVAPPMNYHQHPTHLNNQYYPQPQQPQPQPPANSAMLTRNLIGMLSVNCARLTDLNDKPGYWFVLQDLSVRTEGTFRLKMNFVNVAAADAKSPTKGRVPVLASVFSEPFTVYSAKKFPGVIESTELSKRFATQGIKIPIRKDNTKEEKEEDDDNDNEA